MANLVLVKLHSLIWGAPLKVDTKGASQNKCAKFMTMDR